MEELDGVAFELVGVGAICLWAESMLTDKKAWLCNAGNMWGLMA
jgi:hypothetical protein